MRRVALAALVVAAVGFVGFNAPATADDTSAAIVDNAYTHGTCGATAADGRFSITLGDTITWTNCGMVAHTVTGNSFGSPADIAPGDSVAYTFNTLGTFPYHCENHFQMRGTVNVSEGSPPPPPTTPTTETPPPPTTPTTERPTTTTSTAVATTTTSDDVGGIFDPSSASVLPTTTVFSTGTTRALGTGGEGTSGGFVAVLVVLLVGIAAGAFVVLRRLRAPETPV